MFARVPRDRHPPLPGRGEIGGIARPLIIGASTMGHGHDHSHDEFAAGADVPEALDLSVPDSELSPSDVSRRGFLRGAGLLGAGAAASVFAAPGVAEASGVAHTHGPA